MLSVVVPCFNEEEVIEETYKRLVDLRSNLQQHNYNVELIFVDDGSRDRTRSLLRNMADLDLCTKVIGFARNFGHQIAVSAGIDAACGDAVILIDADLQDPPEVIPLMVENGAKVMTWFMVLEQKDRENLHSSSPLPDFSTGYLIN